MKLNDIHFCFGYVLGKRDKFAADFILNLKSKFMNPEYTRQELQRVLYQNQPEYSVKISGRNKNTQFEVRVFRFIKHTIRSHKNY
jgi:hypothetical protein